MLDQSITLQFHFLILLAYKDHPNIKKFDTGDLEKLLNENKTAWEKVGFNRTKGKRTFRNNVSGHLSRLNQTQYLENIAKGRGIYIRGPKFEEGLRTVVAELTKRLQLDINLGLRALESEETTMELIQEIGEGKVESNILAESYDIRRHFLTTQQMGRLTQLSLEYGIYVP